VTILAVPSAKGHEARLAQYGREGLDRRKDGQFNPAVTDLIIPEMEGSRLSSQWRALAVNKRLGTSLGIRILPIGANRISHVIGAG
jgi:DNA-binding response OmpR family regulator